MRVWAAIIVLTAAMLTAGAGLPALGAARAEEDAANAAGLDPVRSETWEPAVAALRKREDGLAEAMIAVATNENRKADDRRAAVAVLGDLRSARALDFLISRVGLELPVPPTEDKEERLRMSPCAYALVQGRDWRAAQAIVFAVHDEERTPRDLMLLAHVLERILGKDLAVAAVEFRLRQRDSVPDQSIERKNLTGLKTYLQEK